MTSRESRVAVPPWRVIPPLIALALLFSIGRAGAGSAAAQEPVDEQNPGIDSAGWHLRGQEALQRGLARDAIPSLSRALSILPDNLNYGLDLLDAYLAAGELQSASRLVANLRARHPFTAKLEIAAARLNLAQGDWRAALAVLEPQQGKLGADGALLQSQALRLAGRKAHALALLRDASEEFPNRIDVALALARARLDDHQPALALAVVNAAEMRFGRRPELALLAAHAYAAMGREIGAAMVRRVVGGQAGQFSDGWLLLEPRGGADEYLCCPRESAMFQARLALDLAPENREANFLLAELWRRLGKPDVALRLLERLESSRSALDEPALATLAKMALEAGRPNDYLRYSMQRATLAPPERRSEILFEAHLQLARRHNEKGDAASQRESLRRAVGLKSDPATLLALADACWESGAQQEAVAWYGKVLAYPLAQEERERVTARLAGQ